MTCPVVT